MKHLFHVHSHITFLITRQFIIENNIDKNDCFLILTRGYILPVNQKFNTFYYPNDVLDSKYFQVVKGINLFQSYKNKNSLEKYISDLLDQSDFTFYISNTLLDAFSIISCMKQCVGYYLIEEGTAAYLPFGEVPPKYSLKSKIAIQILIKSPLKHFFILRENLYSTHGKNFRGILTISDKSFPNYPGERILLNNPFYKEPIDFVPEIVFSIDPLFSYFNVEQIHSIYQLLKEIFDKKHQTRIAYKFHPDFIRNQQHYYQYKKILEDVFGDNLFEISQESILENIIIGNKADFYSDFSSVALYVNKFGCKCYSYAKLLIGKSRNYDDKILAFNKLKILKESYIQIENV